MMLFAEVIDPGVQQGVSHGLMLVAGMLIPKLFDYLNNRLTVGGRVSALETAVAECAKKHEDCEKDRQKDKAELKARDEKDKAELQAQINSLRAQVNEGK